VCYEASYIELVTLSTVSLSLWSEARKRDIKTLLSQRITIVYHKNENLGFRGVSANPQEIVLNTLTILPTKKPSENYQSSLNTP